MMKAASEILDKMFEETEVDKELRSYLEGIDNEITTILQILI